MSFKELTNMPAIIAICGNPKAGKSTAQKILQEIGGYEPLDDGLPLREIAMQHFSLTPDDVFTQAGKARYSEIADSRWQNRDILGTLGQALEDKFGEDLLPWMACRRLVEGKRYSFGSVRKTQGHFYKKMGGIVIEIVNEGAPPSPYAFDRYDPTAVTFRIVNLFGSNKVTPEMAYANLSAQIRNSLYDYAGISIDDAA